MHRIEYNCITLSFINVLGYCNATWDSFLCWPMTPAETLATLPCPKHIKGIVPGRKLLYLNILLVSQSKVIKRVTQN